MRLGSMVKVTGSTSTNTGVAPVYMTARGQEMIVRSGMMTSSPALISRLATAKCNAAVPLDAVIAWRMPKRFAYAVSKRSM